MNENIPSSRLYATTNDTPWCCSIQCNSIKLVLVSLFVILKNVLTYLQLSHCGIPLLQTVVACSIYFKSIHSFVLFLIFSTC